MYIINIVVFITLTLLLAVRLQSLVNDLLSPLITQSVWGKIDEGEGRRKKGGEKGGGRGRGRRREKGTVIAPTCM